MSLTSLEDMEKTKSKLKEIMLMEKISQLEKQMSLFTTLPLTNDYETIQLNSCNIDDLVIAVYSEEYNSYKIIHKTSTYLHFVHSAIFKSHEQRLSFKNNISNKSVINSSQSQNDLASNQTSTSPPVNDSLSNTNHNIEVESTDSANIKGSSSKSTDNPITVSCSVNDLTTNNMGLASPLVKNSPADDIDSIFLSEKQPQWFVGRVLVKEFCIARRVCAFFDFFTVK
jgi:hypothetical protein